MLTGMIQTFFHLLKSSFLIPTDRREKIKQHKSHIGTIIVMSNSVSLNLRQSLRLPVTATSTLKVVSSTSKWFCLTRKPKFLPPLIKNSPLKPYSNNLTYNPNTSLTNNSNTNSTFSPNTFLKTFQNKRIIQSVLTIKTFLLMQGRFCFKNRLLIDRA